MTANLSKPLLRGHFHQAAFFSSLGACALLIANSVSAGPNAIFSTLVYSITLTTLFGVSAIYHRPQWNDKRRAFMRRLDHAAIFLIIAGTCIPISLLGVRGEIGIQILSLVLAACSVGILKESFWINSPKWVTALLYVGVSWLITPFIPQLWSALGTTNFGFLLGGGIFYTVGAVFYAMKRPKLFPHIFGYHELFHVFVIFGAICHFIVIYRLVNT